MYMGIKFCVQQFWSIYKYNIIRTWLLIYIALGIPSIIINQVAHV